MTAQTRAEPMNSSPHHPKVKVSTTVPDNGLFVAGTHVSGKMEMECRADKGLAIGDMMVELFATQELTSRDHSATSTFLHSRRFFQGPGLPPSNAVQAYPEPGDLPLPKHYYHARRGLSTFLFRIPLPSSSPSSIRFGGNLARVKYELRATVAVIWKGERRLVTHTREVDVVESWGIDFSRVEPEGIVVGEHGKIWAQGKVIGGMVVAGETGCLELQVKNHSSKRNTGLTITLGRQLLLPGAKASEKHATLQISDVLTTVPFRGPEYIIRPGAEGVASLVFDVPKAARGAKGGMLGDDSEGRTVESLFEVHCTLTIAINMGVGTKDIQLNLPVSIIHPAALPEPEPYSHPPYIAPYPEPPVAPYIPQQPPYGYPVATPIPVAFIDEAQNQVWLPPPVQNTPQPILQQYPNYSPQMYLENQCHNVHDLSPQPVPVFLPPRPLSAGPTSNNSHGHVLYGGIGMGPPPRHPQQLLSVPLGDLDMDTEVQEGKGERAERVAQHLRLSSRHRSVSPQSHRFPLPQPQPSTTQYGRSLPLPPLRLLDPSHHTSLGPSEESTQTMVVHSPRPFLSPRRSYSSSTNASLAKSERVEELERMAEEVKKTTEDLSADLPDLALARGAKSESAAVTEVGLDGKMHVGGGDINKTLPGTPPSLTVKDPEEIRDSDWRTRIDAFFSTSVPPPPAPILAPQLVTKPKTPPIPIGAITSGWIASRSRSVNVKSGLLPDLQAPPTPHAAITPIKMPTRVKSTEVGVQRQLLSTGGGCGGLDALERRLLAEVGTRKMEMKLDGDERRLDVRSLVKPIDIPGRDVGVKKEEEEQPLNDSAISSLALGGEGMGVAAGLLGPGWDVEREQEHDGDGDSDEKTHRGGRSSGSAGSRKIKGERGRQRGRKSDEDEREGGKRKKKKKEGKVGTSKKAEAAKGRVTAWLGGIEPEVPPMEEVVPSVSVTSKTPPFLKDPSVGSSDVGAEDPDRWKDPVQREMKDKPTVPTEISSAPNPRSSGFVPIGTLKHDTLQYRRFHVPSKESTIVKEAKRVADLWFSPSPPAAVTRSPIQKEVLPKLPLISSQPVQTIGTDKRVSPPSSAAAIDALGAKHYQTNAVKPLTTTGTPAVPVAPMKKVVVHQPSPRLPVFPPRVKQDPEVKYDVRSARGGRGGQVAAIASIWGTGSAAEPKSQEKRSAAGRLGAIPKPRMKPIAEDPAKNADEVPSTPPSSQPQRSFKPERSDSNDQPKKSFSANPALRTPQVSMPLKPTLAARTSSVPAPASHKDFKPVENIGKIARPLVKSTSIPVPAIVSSSHATPMLSSTASLARPAAANKVRSAAVRVVTSEIPVQPSISVVKSGDLAFGQARLRDLIKKYQG